MSSSSKCGQESLIRWTLTATPSTTVQTRSAPEACSRPRSGRTSPTLTWRSVPTWYCRGLDQFGITHRCVPERHVDEVLLRGEVAPGLPAEVTHRQPAPRASRQSDPLPRPGDACGC